MVKNNAFGLVRWDVLVIYMGIQRLEIRHLYFLSLQTFHTQATMEPLLGSSNATILNQTKNK